MKGLGRWIQLFLLTSIILGWAQWGACWIFCEVVIRNQDFFYPLMGFSLSFNIGVAFLWMGGMHNAEVAKKEAAEAKKEAAAQRRKR